MLDPIPLSPWLRDATKPLANWFHLNTLPLHIHEVLLAYGIYNFIDIKLSPYLTEIFLPGKYQTFSRRTQLHWNMHITSFVNSIFLSVAASYVLYADAELRSESWEDRIWGYTGAAGLVQAFGAGFFLWDVQTCLINFSTLGVPDLAHAAVALMISILGFRPFGLYYGIQYALLELSTPFVNIHWVLNKLDKAGSNLQLVNGAILIVTFGCCRLLWGMYMTIPFFRDVWTALHQSNASWTAYDFLPYAKESLVLQHQSPWWVAALFVVAHTTVMSLSTFWFSKMIATMRKHLAHAGEERRSKLI